MIQELYLPELPLINLTFNIISKPYVFDKIILCNHPNFIAVSSRRNLRLCFNPEVSYLLI